MRRIALLSLIHDRSKLVASIAGVTFAAVLVLLQMGVYAGFLMISSATITHMGGDVWVMPRGTEVLDSVEILSSGTRSAVGAHPCVSDVRPLVFVWSFIRKAGGTRDSVRVVGVERGRGPIMPWELERGLPSDLEGPGRVAVDAFDLGKLQIQGDPIGARLDIGGQRAEIAGITQGVRSFTLLPFVFTNIRDARRMAGLGDGEANYWVVDLKDPACAEQVMGDIQRNPQLMAVRREDFVTMTQNYWIGGSGVGPALGFSALLGLIVGVVVVGQTLYTMTKDYERELATLKALGATSWELVRFVGWQAGFLALIGSTLGSVIAFMTTGAAAAGGLTIVLSSSVMAVGLGAVILMCVAASFMSIRKVLKLQAAEVFK